MSQAKDKSDDVTQVDDGQPGIGGLLLNWGMEFLGLGQHKQIANEALGLLDEKNDTGKQIKGILKDRFGNRKLTILDGVALLYAAPRIPWVGEIYNSLKKMPVVGKVINKIEEKKSNLHEFIARKYNNHLAPLIGKDGSALIERIASTPALVEFAKKINETVQGAINRVTPDGEEAIKFDVLDFCKFLPHEISSDTVSRIVSTASILPFVNNIFPEGTELGGLKRAGTTAAVFAGVISELVGVQVKTVAKDDPNSAVAKVMAKLAGVYDFGMELIGSAPLGNSVSVKLNDEVLDSPVNTIKYLKNGGSLGALDVATSDIVAGRVYRETTNKKGDIDKTPIEVPDFIKEAPRGAAWYLIETISKANLIAKAVASGKLDQNKITDISDELSKKITGFVQCCIAAVADEKMTPDQAREAVDYLMASMPAIEHDDLRDLAANILSPENISQITVPMADVLGADSVKKFDQKRGDIAAAKSLVSALNLDGIGLEFTDKVYHLNGSGVFGDKAINNNLPSGIVVQPDVSVQSADTSDVSSDVSSDTPKINMARHSAGLESLSAMFMLMRDAQDSLDKGVDRTIIEGLVEPLGLAVREVNGVLKVVEPARYASQVIRVVGEEEERIEKQVDKIGNAPEYDSSRLAPFDVFISGLGIQSVSDGKRVSDTHL